MAENLYHTLALVINEKNNKMTSAQDLIYQYLKNETKAIASSLKMVLDFQEKQIDLKINS